MFKIAILAATVSATFAKKGKNMNPFGEDAPYYYGSCVFRNAESKKVGCLKFHQECTDDAEDEPTAMSIRTNRGLEGSRYSIDVYNEDPMMEGVVAVDSLGEFMPNRIDMINVFGLFNDDITLQGPATLEGGYLGITCQDTNTLIGCCEIKVTKKGEHEHDDDMPESWGQN